MSDADRHTVLHELQGILVEWVREFHNKERLKAVYDPAQSTRQFISELPTLAEETGMWGPVAQYLVGAKEEMLRLEINGIVDDSHSVRAVHGE